MDAAWLDRVCAEELARRRQEWEERERVPLEPIDATHFRLGQRSYVNFASNDYLSLSRHPAVIEAMQSAMRARGAGSGASPLVTGYTDLHRAAEVAIANWKGAAAAVLLPSGYQTAHAIVQTLAGIRSFCGAGVRFLLDKLSHASLVDAVLASGMPHRVFPHNHLPKLERLLGSAPSAQLQVVITESIFSMEGDAADLVGLMKLKQHSPFVLVLDEAHASGVYGPDGGGYAAECGLADAIDVTLVTFSKAAGLAGGAVCASDVLCQAMANWGRAYIYSTSVPPALCAGISAAIGVMRREPDRQRRVRELAKGLRRRLASAGLNTPAGDSPIIPILLGSKERAMEAAERLRQQGLWVGAIRPPTVARGTSRLRVTLSCEHKDGEVEHLAAALCDVAA
jgi:8-amino-7-oxononanoate synthase